MKKAILTIDFEDTLGVAVVFVLICSRVSERPLNCT